MSLFTWLPTIEEIKDFKTYNYTEPSMGDGIDEFSKNNVPNFCQMPTEDKEIQAKQYEWFNLSNREDLLILEMQKLAFDKFYSDEKKDILRHL